MVELSWDTRLLREICENPGRALESLPEEVCRELQDRLADLDAAESMADLVIGDPKVDSRPPGRVSYLLPEGFEVMCVGSYSQPPLNLDPPLGRDVGP